MAPQIRPPVSANQGDAPSRSIFSRIYMVIMTPLIFISFVVSLAIVDFRYSLRRSRNHTESSQNNGPRQTATRTPSWLHRLLFKYRYVAVSETRDNQQPSDEKSRSRWGTYYHTKQRKLLKMEAADAFEIRSTVLALLGILSLGLLWGVWRVLSWGLYATGLRG